MKMYMVGGCVRDELMGLPSKDIDFSVVLDDEDKRFIDASPGMLKDPFNYMVDQLKSYRYTVHKSFPEHLTARGKFPKDHFAYPGLDADFVLARKEGSYSDGRRPDFTEPGSLDDDLNRRDFTMNAIAKDSEGNFIDPHDGATDIKHRLIRAVGDPYERISEDALRALRAVRFSVTKNMRIEDELLEVIDSYEVADLVRDNIADERIRDELRKMFRFDTMNSIHVLNSLFNLTPAIFSGRVSLDSTLKTKGRG